MTASTAQSNILTRNTSPTKLLSASVNHILPFQSFPPSTSLSLCSPYYTALHHHHHYHHYSSPILHLLLCQEEPALIKNPFGTYGTYSHKKLTPILPHPSAHCQIPLFSPTPRSLFLCSCMHTGQLPKSLQIPRSLFACCVELSFWRAVRQLKLAPNNKIRNTRKNPESEISLLAQELFGREHLLTGF